MRPKKRRLRLDNGKRKDLCGIHAAALRHCECCYQQAFRQKAADAMEQARYSSAFAGLEPSTEPFNQPFRAGSPKCPTVSIITIISRPPRECHTNLMLSKNHRSKSARFLERQGNLLILVNGSRRVVDTRREIPYRA